ncbi:MAG: hypothetical protein M3Y85_00275 [Bacteroidota bacterium]|nr:hypothetical protein [Bacteroidota bacterium]
MHNTLAPAVGAAHPNKPGRTPTKALKIDFQWPAMIIADELKYLKQCNVKMSRQ